LLGLVLLAGFVPFFRWVLAAEVFIYIFVLLLAGSHAALKYRKPFLLPGLPMAISIMHLAWGSANRT
jgi:hypothetical protein